MQKQAHFFPRDASPYSTPAAKAMALPNRVVMEKLRKMGNSAILRDKEESGFIWSNYNSVFNIEIVDSQYITLSFNV